MTSDLDEAEQNIPKITTEPDPTGYTRRALECLVAHMRNEYAMVNALIRHTGTPWNDHLRASAPSAATLSERMLAAVARGLAEPSAANRPEKLEGSGTATGRCGECGSLALAALCKACGAEWMTASQIDALGDVAPSDANRPGKGESPPAPPWANGEAQCQGERESYRCLLVSGHAGECVFFYPDPTDEELARLSLVAEIAELRRKLDALLPVAMAAVRTAAAVADGGASLRPLILAVNNLPADVREELGKETP